MLIDLASSLYLGLYHPSASLPAWSRLTTGAPAALVEPPGSARVARALAASIGGSEGLLMSSTLHLFVDLFMHGLPGAALFWDEALYPVAALGVELARARGAPARPLPHLAPSLDARWLVRHTPRGRIPVIVTDGFCVGCGSPAPLARYAEAVGALGGLVVVDDTQALGVLGADPTPEAPFGTGGGGSVRHQKLEGAPLVIGASLAKAFGVPIACLVGARGLLSSFVEHSETRVHTSPPAQPLICAAWAALVSMANTGAERRRALLRNILHVRRGLSALGVEAHGGLFPVQSIDAGEVGGDEHVCRMHGALAARGIRTAMCRARCGPELKLTFVLRADHTLEHLDRVLREVHRALPAARARSGLGATRTFARVGHGAHRSPPSNHQN